MGHLQELYQDQNGIQLGQWGQEGTRRGKERRQKRVGGEKRHDLGTKYAEWLYSK